MNRLPRPSGEGGPDNLSRLAACVAHDFGRDDRGRRYFCRRCGGRVSAEAAHWYSGGLEAGRRLERIAREVAAAKAAEVAAA